MFRFPAGPWLTGLVRAQSKRRSRRRGGRHAIEEYRQLGLEALEPRLLLSADLNWVGGPEFQVNEYTDDTQTFATAAVADNGHTVVAWVSDGQDGDSYGVYARSIDAEGHPLSEPFQVNTTTQGSQLSPAIGLDRNGNGMITWRGEGPEGYGGYARRYEAGQGLVGETFRIAPNFADIAMNGDGEALIVWVEGERQTQFHPKGYDIYGRWYDPADGFGDPFQVNTTTHLHQSAAVAAIDAEGNAFVAWESEEEAYGNRDIYGRQFNADGAPATEQDFRINSLTAENQRQPSVAMSGNGSGLVTWGSGVLDTAQYDIHGQRFDADGAPTGEEFRVNSTEEEYQVTSSAVMDGRGYALVVWMSYGDLGEESDVYGQFYDPAGEPIGEPEFIVNEDVSGRQGGPSAAMAPGGDVQVAWPDGGLPDTEIVTRRLLANRAPGADAGGPYAIDEGQGLTLDASASSDRDGDTLSYDWDLDGDAAFDDASGVQPELTWEDLVGVGIDDNGDYSVSVRVRDGNGGEDKDSASLAVTNIAPAASDQTLQTDEDAAISGRASASDVAADPLTFSLSSPAGYGSVDLSSDGSFTYTPNTGFSGTDSFAFEATDDEGLSSTGLITIEVLPSNQAPVAEPDAFSIDEDQTLHVEAEVNGRLHIESDEDHWVGQGGTFDLATPDAHFGAVQNLHNGVWFSVHDSSDSWSLDFAAPDGARITEGEYPNATEYPFEDAGEPGLSITGNDNGCSTSTGSFTVHNVDYGSAEVQGDPIAAFAADFVYSCNTSSGSLTGSIEYNQGTAGGVLSNDSDPDGDELRAVLAEGPEHGTLSLDSYGGFSYTPDENFNGTDSFTYRASDGELESEPVEVTINVNPVNDAPTVADQGFELEENSASGTAVGVVEAEDVDGDALSYAITGGSGEGAFDIDSSTGEITVSDSDPLDFETNPEFQITVQASDDKLTDTATVTIDLLDVNESPTLDDTSFTIAENSAAGTVLGTLAGTDPDAGDTDGLTYAITGGSGEGAFDIDTTAGEIFVSDPALLDYEASPELDLIVRATDEGGLSDEATVGVGLTDVFAVTIGDASIEEGNGPSHKIRTSEMTFTVGIAEAEPLTDPAASGVVSWQTLDGTATAGEDYLADSGTLTFDPNRQSHTITVDVIRDKEPEPDETFSVELSAESGPIALRNGQAVGTILDDDGKDSDDGGGGGGGDDDDGNNGNGWGKGGKKKSLAQADSLWSEPSTGHAAALGWLRQSYETGGTGTDLHETQDDEDDGPVDILAGLPALRLDAG